MSDELKIIDELKIEELRGGIDSLTTRAAIREWLEIAEVAGIDPL